MEPDKSAPEKDRRQYTFNMILVAVAGQAGCLTVLIIFAALFTGLWLDSIFDTRPLFTILLMIGSVPVTLVAMLWVVRAATSRMKPAVKAKTDNTQEAQLRGE